MVTTFIHLVLRLIAFFSAAGVATAVSAAVFTPTAAPRTASIPTEPAATTASTPIIPVATHIPLPLETPTAKPTYVSPSPTPTRTHVSPSVSSEPTHTTHPKPHPKPKPSPKPHPKPKPKPHHHKPVHYTTPSGVAQSYAADKVGGENFSCLVKLWTRESSWDTHAENTDSGAYGIPQSLPGSKMASYGSDWRDNYRTQINWGLNYIEGRYGSACAAWAHSESVGWY